MNTMIIEDGQPNSSFFGTEGLSNLTVFGDLRTLGIEGFSELKDNLGHGTFFKFAALFVGTEQTEVHGTEIFLPGQR